MIFTAIITLSAVIVSTILLIFPTSSGFPVEVDNAVSFIGGYVGMFDPLIPMSTLGQILVLVLTFELAVFGFKAFKWVISHVPLVGGRG
jgi:hypothetical protein